ncbi:hypothetical protein [Novosphingobium sp.]|uniref:hypothetical protein n=1 Tax=Novosphingobium sp. TaxID=1874826 RepID=UPI002624824D|nr:hypothetical protein [Novosphingobium sp.]
MPAANETHQLDYLRTKVWFARASERAGGKSPDWFWQNIDQGYGDRSTWYRYRRGERAAFPYAGRDRVSLVESKVPMTSWLFWSPAWEVLQRKTLPVDTIVLGIAELRGPPAAILLGYGYPGDGDLTFEQIANDVLARPSLEGLLGVVLLLGWADALQNYELWNEVCRLYRQLIPRLWEAGDIPFLDELLDAVDGIAATRSFPTVNRREEHFTSWRLEMDRIEEERKSAAAEVAKYWKSLPKYLRG